MLNILLSKNVANNLHFMVDNSSHCVWYAFTFGITLLFIAYGIFIIDIELRLKLRFFPTARTNSCMHSVTV